MTSLVRPVQRVTTEPYKHYRRPIVITLYADVISLRLKGTRTSYEIPVSYLLDDLCRREARRIALERRARKRKNQGGK